jgi:hypothetical protein
MTILALYDTFANIGVEIEMLMNGMRSDGAENHVSKSRFKTAIDACSRLSNIRQEVESWYSNNADALNSDDDDTSPDPIKLNVDLQDILTVRNTVLSVMDLMERASADDDPSMLDATALNRLREKKNLFSLYLEKSGGIRDVIELENRIVDLNAKIEITTVAVLQRQRESNLIVDLDDDLSKVGQGALMNVVDSGGDFDIQGVDEMSGQTSTAQSGTTTAFKTAPKFEGISRLSYDDGQ